VDQVSVRVGKFERNTTRSAGATARHFRKMELASHWKVNAGAMLRSGDRVHDRLDLGINQSRHPKLGFPAIHIYFKFYRLE
jgi:hypothetical protein